MVFVCAFSGKEYSDAQGEGILSELNLQIENIVCSLDKEPQGAVSAVATILREKGQNVDLVLENKPLK
ncbi:hypothetical protein CQW23_10275 [Capsicum baccatum]|uniref:Uncharacterized protein n=1 Tax=Capsicum baccatum TaxID=33114 RepID=A0A2G2WZ57_CAPBA|nr:hypothetical protein CQW23_10275 [Capsicum baccatum]